MSTFERYVHDRTIYVTYTNHGYIDYTTNLFISCQLAKVPWKLLIIAMDKQAQESLAARMIPSVLYELDCCTEYQNYLAPAFKNICYFKFDVLKMLMMECKTLGSVDHIVYIDGDIWIERDFSEQLTPYKIAGNDITFQCDEGHTRDCAKPCRFTCNGLMMLSLTGNFESVIKLLDFRKNPRWQSYKHDQDYTYYVLPHSGVKYNTLDRTIFPNGYHARVNSIPPNYYLIHYNWLIGDEKIEHMKKNGHWSITNV